MNFSEHVTLYNYQADTVVKYKKVDHLKLKKGINASVFRKSRATELKQQQIIHYRNIKANYKSTLHAVCLLFLQTGGAVAWAPKRLEID